MSWGTQFPATAGKKPRALREMRGRPGLHKIVAWRTQLPCGGGRILRKPRESRHVHQTAGTGDRDEDLLRVNRRKGRCFAPGFLCRHWKCRPPISVRACRKIGEKCRACRLLSFDVRSIRRPGSLAGAKLRSLPAWTRFLWAARNVRGGTLTCKFRACFGTRGREKAALFAKTGENGGACWFGTFSHSGASMDFGRQLSAPPPVRVGGL